MEATTLYQLQATTNTEKVYKHSPFMKLINWCNSQNENRLLWLGIILAAHGCVLTPLTAMTVLLTGANFSLFMLAMSAMGMSLVTNLAAMPTKYTIPTFALSILIDVVVVIAGIAMV